VHDAGEHDRLITPITSLFSQLRMLSFLWGGFSFGACQQQWAKTSSWRLLVAAQPGVASGAWRGHSSTTLSHLVVNTMAICRPVLQFYGYEVSTEGDAFLVAFHEPFDAVAWCLCVQLALHCEWITLGLVGGVVVRLAGRAHLSCPNLRQWIAIDVDI
jgi:hypothetical protein